MISNSWTKEYESLFGHSYSYYTRQKTNKEELEDMIRAYQWANPYFKPLEENETKKPNKKLLLCKI